MIQPEDVTTSNFARYRDDLLDRTLQLCSDEDMKRIGEAIRGNDDMTQFLALTMTLLTGHILRKNIETPIGLLLGVAVAFYYFGEIGLLNGLPGENHRDNGEV